MTKGSLHNIKFFVDVEAKALDNSDVTQTSVGWLFLSEDGIWEDLVQIDRQTDRQING